jgi:hypothetical protein
LNYVNPFPAFPDEIIHDNAICNSEECVVAAFLDIQTRMNVGATLPDKNIPGSDDLTTEFLHTQALSLAISTVAA